MPKDEQLQHIVRPILDWYGEHKRDLPWRHTRDPYRIWVSEIMLQQTRVDTVIDYYNRFLRELPTVEDLAACDEQKLLKLWEGLGYYTRARNLAKAAAQIVEAGSFPSHAAEIARLPGVGSYTAGAIASIAFERAEPAVDGNVLRVVSRITGDYRVIDDQSVKQDYTERLRGVYPSGECGDFTQSLMELGALICVPNGEPKCAQCPLRSLCTAHSQDLTAQIPARAQKRPRKVEKRTMLLLVCRGRVGVVRREEDGLLAGLWEFLSVDGASSESQIVSGLSERGVGAKVVARGQGKHIFTHVEWQMEILTLDCDAQVTGVTYASREELDASYPMPTAMRDCKKQLEKIWLSKN